MSRDLRGRTCALLLVKRSSASRTKDKLSSRKFAMMAGPDYFGFSTMAKRNGCFGHNFTTGSSGCPSE